jgi:hypothetical protein
MDKVGELENMDGSLYAVAAHFNGGSILQELGNTPNNQQKDSLMIKSMPLWSCM